MTLPDKTDVLIVGAGPAGLSAARQLQKAGIECLLIDAREKIGHPLRCAEIVPASHLKYFDFDPPASWLRPLPEDHRIDATFFNPDGSSRSHTVTHNNEKWLMLDRPKSEFEASEVLKRNGMNVITACALTGLGPFDGKGRLAQLQYKGRPHSVQARIVIAADGQSSLTARMAGLHDGLSPSEVISYYVYWMDNLEVDTAYSSMIFYPEIAPFYFWFFPNDDKTANVGLGVNGLRGHASKGILDRIIANFDRCQGGRVADTIIGWTPSTQPMSSPYTDGLLVTGTAAFYVGAISGEGILPASQSGYHAAKTIIDLGDAIPDARALANYKQRVEFVIQEHEAYWQHLHILQKAANDNR